jgi:hypothetical protein
MAPDTNPAELGRMTVPPLFGWEGIVTVLVVVIALAVLFAVAASAGRGSSQRSEWQAWLDARSSRPGAPPAGPGDRSAVREVTDGGS